MKRADEKYFLPYQADVIRDQSGLIIVEKGRQIGLSYAVSYKAVTLSALKNGRDTWVMSRDEVQAKQFILYCKRWANVLKYAANDLGEQVLEDANGKPFKVQVLTFASGASIYALSSNPDAIVGKTGNFIGDEFAVAKNQRDLYAISKQVTQWGGQYILISTHRGVSSVFNSIITDIKERNNPMGWSLHTIPIQRAVADGLVKKINAATGKNETDEEWLSRMRRECIDEEQWLQEYCCIPADESSAFITYEMITGCEDDSALKDFAYLEKCTNPLYIGFDVARKKDLSVIDVEEKVGDVFWERMRIEMLKKKFAEQEFELYRLLKLPLARRCCIDSTGLGMQLAERAIEKFGNYRVEAVGFTNQVKSDLAYPLRAAHEDHTLRYRKNEKLRADLRGIKKETTAANNIRFIGDGDDSHCDRFWAKALALHAGRTAGTWGGGKGAILV